MSATPSDNHEQAALWNSPAARGWIEAQELTDKAYKGFEERLAEAAAAKGALRLLDVGCGTGSTTLAIAGRLNGNGVCMGIDISEQMIAAARHRMEKENIHDGAAAEFLCADAQTHAFEPECFDMIVSRFGVMFFANPVKAFANLRRAASTGAQLRFFAWRSAGENPFMTAAERAAAPLLPDLKPRPLNGPGQFGFADPQYVRSVLDDSGWVNVDVRPVDIDCAFAAAELDLYVTRFGPAARVLQEADEKTREHVIEVLREAFDSYVYGAEVRFTAACWDVQARNVSDLG